MEEFQFFNFNIPYTRYTESDAHHFVRGPFSIYISLLLEKLFVNEFLRIFLQDY